MTPPYTIITFHRISKGGRVRVRVRISEWMKQQPKNIRVESEARQGQINNMIGGVIDDDSSSNNSSNNNNSSSSDNSNSNNSTYHRPSDAMTRIRSSRPRLNSYSKNSMCLRGGRKVGGERKVVFLREGGGEGGGREGVCF